jgi:circadian clock protein KaiC
MTKTKTASKHKQKIKVLPVKRPQLPKVLTGIEGLDTITNGGLPKGRPTLVCGNTGCGKTLLAMEFLVKGATQFNEPGVFMAFEESTNDLVANVASLGFDLKGLIASKKIAVDFVYIERDEVAQAGEYNLDALFIRLGSAIDAIGAKRVVLDTIESLFSSLPNQAILRAELRRLFRWLKDKGVTAIITGESGVDTISRQGLEEYVSDCVILLDSRIEDQIASRRLRIVKYRGSLHGTNEYPFLIDEDGISLIPITSTGLNYHAATGRVSTGIPRLDAMLGCKGFYRGSSIMYSGTAGTGKSSFLAHFADAACKRGERVLFCAFEESPSQITRNMKSIGFDLDHWIKKDLLKIESVRPSQFGLDMHLIMIQKMVTSFKPQIVIMDPITSFSDHAKSNEVKRILMKLVDFLKSKGITAMFSSLTPSGTPIETSHVAISSLVDSWVLLRDIESNGERNRGLYILKSRGMNHSNQVREFLITNTGVELIDVYSGAGGVLTGGARLSMLAQEKAFDVRTQEETELRHLAVENKRNILDAKIAEMRAEFAAQEAANITLSAQEKLRSTQLSADKTAMRKIRGSDSSKLATKGKGRSK